MGPHICGISWFFADIHSPSTSSSPCLTRIQALMIPPAWACLSLGISLSNFKLTPSLSPLSLPTSNTLPSL